MKAQIITLILSCLGLITAYSRYNAGDGVEMTFIIFGVSSFGFAISLKSLKEVYVDGF